MPTATAQGALLASYPPAALAAHVDGEATLACKRTERGALSGCRLLEETPKGYGFGAAALALAGGSADGCGPPLPPSARAARPIRFAFSVSPPAIVPDPRHAGWILAAAKWRSRPNYDQVLGSYPERAARAGVEGDTALQCLVAEDGHMTDCAVIAEIPPGYDFRYGAVRLSRFFVLDPATCDSRLAGVTVVIPIAFRLPLSGSLGLGPGRPGGRVIGH